MYNKLLTHAKFSGGPKANLNYTHKYTQFCRARLDPTLQQGVFPPVGVQRRCPWLARCGSIKSKSLEAVDFQNVSTSLQIPQELDLSTPCILLLRIAVLYKFA